MVRTKVSSYGEYKVKIGLLCTEQLKNLGQNGICYCKGFDEWTDISMYMHGVSKPEYTNGRNNFILGQWRGGGKQVFSSLQWGGGGVKQLWGNRYFFNIRFQFQEPHGGNR